MVSQHNLRPSSSYDIFATDFDGTISDTGQQNGVLGVNDAYVEVIQSIKSLGETAAETFIAQGGHNHRTPTEIILSLLPDIAPENLKELSTQIVGGKLEILTGQIGTLLPNGERWPQPIDGFTKVWEGLHHSDQPSTAIISAGHTRFIQRWFSYFNLQQPDCMVTYDTVQSMRSELTPPQNRQTLAKPSRQLMEIALNILGINRPASSQRILYTGDSPEKDVTFAQNCGAEFVLIKPNHIPSGWQEAGRRLGIHALAGVDYV